MKYPYVTEKMVRWNALAVNGIPLTAAKQPDRMIISPLTSVVRHTLECEERYGCLACDEMFITLMVARDHIPQCSELSDFQRITGRNTSTIGSVLSPKHTKTVPYTYPSESRRLLHWSKLKSAPSKMNAKHRWGLFAINRGTKYCLACRCHFNNVQDMKQHVCQFEEEFRRVTGRSQFAVIQEKESNSEPKSMYWEYWESFVQWNYSLLLERDSLKNSVTELQLDLDKAFTELDEALKALAHEKKETEYMSKQLNAARVVNLNREQALAFGKFRGQ